MFETILHSLSHRFVSTFIVVQVVKFSSPHVREQACYFDVSLAHFAFQQTQARADLLNTSPCYNIQYIICVCKYINKDSYLIVIVNVSI